MKGRVFGGGGDGVGQWVQVACGQSEEFSLSRLVVRFIGFCLGYGVYLGFYGYFQKGLV